jgi:lysophospholipase L1-like esterase
MPSFRNFFVNAALSLATFVICLLFCELILFRFFWLASDVPRNDFVNGIVRYAPNQSGVWRIRNEIAASYAINAQGWNSGIGDYRLDKSPGTFRIAVVGDSFVEALQVAHDRSLGERLAAELAHDGRGVEVLRFGISGAPMSQYLNVIEREVARYRPDVIVVLIVHNDFDESFEFVPGRYTSSFLKLRIENGRVVGEIPPAAWAATPADWLRHTATARFFYYRWQVGSESIKNLLIGSVRADTGRFSANVDTNKIAALRADMTAAADYTFGRIVEAARAMGARLIIAIDGDRGAIYAGDANPVALVLNGIASEAAKRHGIGFVDLQPIFAADWQANRLPFDFASDGHWNEYGHAVAAKAIAQALDARQ